MTAQVLDIFPPGASLHQIYSSICNGLIDNLASMMPNEFMKSAGVEKLVTTGSVIEKNEAVRSRIQEVFSLPIEFASSGEVDSAFGATVAALNFCSPGHVS